MGITARLADFVVSTTFPAIPREVVQKSKEMMLNAAAVGLAGSTQKEARAIVEFTREMGGNPKSTLLGAGVRTSPVNAALANGIMVHVLDYEEAVLRRGNHPSNVMFPTVMALGEYAALSGEEVVTAFALGCEVSTKIGAAGSMDEMGPYMGQHGWHLEGVAGAIGAAAAAGKMLGLGQEEMVNALGLAVSMASGARVNFGTSGKSLHCGHAAKNGITAAMLAQKGLTAAGNAIEHDHGYFGLYRRDTNVDEEEFIGRLGHPYDVIDPGVAFKIYPCGSATHTSLDCFREVVRDYKLTPDQIKSVRVSVPPEHIMPFSHPETGLQGKFCFNYALAVALIHGQPRIDHFTDEAVKDPKVRAFLDKVTVDGAEHTTREVSRPASVVVTLNDGRVLRNRVEHPKGHPANPLTVGELNDKFRLCAKDTLSPRQMDNAITQFRELETLPEVKPLFSLLGGRPR